MCVSCIFILFSHFFPLLSTSCLLSHRLLSFILYGCLLLSSSILPYSIFVSFHCIFLSRLATFRCCWFCPAVWNDAEGAVLLQSAAVCSCSCLCSCRCIYWAFFRANVQIWWFIQIPQINGTIFVVGRVFGRLFDKVSGSLKHFQAHRTPNPCSTWNSERFFVGPMKPLCIYLFNNFMYYLLKAIHLLYDTTNVCLFERQLFLQVVCRVLDMKFTPPGSGGWSSLVWGVP